MQQRKDEIAAKKAKLAELKRQRELRHNGGLQRGQGSEGHSELVAAQSISNTAGWADNRKDLDSLISSLVGEGLSASKGPKETSTSSQAARGTRSSPILNTTRIGTELGDETLGTPSRTQPARTTSIATQTLSTADIAINYEYLPANLKPEVLSYSKGIQTTDLWSPQRTNRSTDGFSDSDLDESPSRGRTPKASKRLSRREKEREEEIRQSLRRDIEEELNAVKGPTAKSPITLDTEPKFPARALTQDEMSAMTSSGDFLEFVERSSKIIERTLDQDYDVLADYALDGLNGLDEDEDEGYASSRGKKGRRVKEVAHFYDERWSKKRMISDINFSAKFPELLLASYTKNPSAPQDPSGLLQIWNLYLHSRPEYTFHSTSDILTAKFSPFHPSLILGGTYSGQVLLWDTRSRTPFPVQKTPLTGGGSTGGHTHPIYSLDIVGTQNANNIISCSTDGVVCGWAVDMLSQPQEYLELTTPPPSKTEDLSPTCMAFPPSDPTSFLVGTEEGTIYPCQRYDRAGAKAGVDTRVRYRSHTAPVMSMNFHPARGPLDLSDLVLSSSLDWTVKLWKIRTPSSAAAAAAAAAAASSSSSSTFSSTTAGGLTGTATPNAHHEIHPVMEFPREDVVYDARWSPVRPGVFALVDGAGEVEIWDLLVDTEIPVVKAAPAGSGGLAGFGGHYAPKSLNKVAWEEKEGRRVGVGGAAGVVTVFELGSELGGDGVKGDEWAAMKRMVGRTEMGRR